MNYLRQLRNDEKRASYTLVADINANLLAREFIGDESLVVMAIPHNSVVLHSYMIVVEAFATGSLIVDAGVIDGEAAGEDWYLATPIEVVGVVTNSLIPAQGLYRDGNELKVSLNTAAIASAVGKLQFVVEYTEVPVATGTYAT